LIINDKNCYFTPYFIFPENLSVLSQRSQKAGADNLASTPHIMLADSCLMLQAVAVLQNGRVHHPLLTLSTNSQSLLRCCILLSARRNGL